MGGPFDEPLTEAEADAIDAQMAAGQLVDWRPLDEDVTMHTMIWCGSHPDGRWCAYHSRLGVWTFEGIKECLRDDHPDLAQPVSAPEDQGVKSDG